MPSGVPTWAWAGAGKSLWEWLSTKIVHAHVYEYVYNDACYISCVLRHWAWETPEPEWMWSPLSQWATKCEKWQVVTWMKKRSYLTLAVILAQALNVGFLELAFIWTASIISSWDWRQTSFEAIWPQFCPGNPGSDTNIKIVIGRIGWFGLCGLHCLVEFVSLPECFVAMYAVRSAPRGTGHPANTKRANASCCVGTAAVSAIRGTSTQSHRT